MQKAIRRGQEAEALFWGQELMDSGHAYHMWRRMVVIAAEDVGLAQPDLTAQMMTMKQAHDFARESNIPFQAIMMLCRAPKNREADDASYLYDLKMKAGWKIPVPPEAVDGHTRRGRTNLYRLADQTGQKWDDLWNKEFYFDVGLLRNYVEIETDGISEKYRKALMEFLRLPFDTYDIDTCRQPRITSGRKAPKSDVLGAGKSLSGGVDIRPVANTETGEIRADKLECQSFTDPQVWYELTVEKAQGQLIVLDCSCPAHEKTGAVCKHMQAVLRAGGPTK